jgi:hypothetical protein
LALELVKISVSNHAAPYEKTITDAKQY